MTNGEKIKEIFPNAEIDKGKDGNDIIWIAIDGWTTFTKDWWNAEYKEPTTKNDLGVDCISRQVISDYVESHIQEINTGYGDLNRHTNSILRMIVDYIENMPSVTPQELRWIPVNEKLPDIHNYSENYLVTLKRGCVCIGMFVECDGRNWWTHDDVVAWMPLPKAYREVEE